MICREFQGILRPGASKRNKVSLKLADIINNTDATEKLHYAL